MGLIKPKSLRSRREIEERFTSVKQEAVCEEEIERRKSAGSDDYHMFGVFYAWRSPWSVWSIWCCARTSDSMHGAQMWTWPIPDLQIACCQYSYFSDDLFAVYSISEMECFQLCMWCEDTVTLYCFEQTMQSVWKVLCFANASAFQGRWSTLTTITTYHIVLPFFLNGKCLNKINTG